MTRDQDGWLVGTPEEMMEQQHRRVEKALLGLVYPGSQSPTLRGQLPCGCHWKQGLIEATGCAVHDEEARVLSRWHDVRWAS